MKKESKIILRQEKRMSVPILSICIPTFNRCEILKQCIESAISQKEFLDKTVEIVVSDNSSTDLTEKICKKFEKQYCNFIYIRNEENIQDANFPNVLLHANGILRKLCNDSIVFEPESLAFMCSIARKYEKEKPILFFQNKVAEESLSTDLQGLCYKASYNMTWIGSFSIWDSECKDMSVTKYTETKLWQTYQLMDRIVFGKNVVVITNHIFSQQSVDKKDLSYGLYQVFCNNYLNLMREQVIKRRISEECFAWLEKDLLYNFFENWMIQIQLNSSSYIVNQSEKFVELIEKHYKNKVYFDDFKADYERKLKDDRDRQEMILPELRAFTNKFQDISIYGAGKIARKYYEYLEKIGIKCKTFYVSELHNNINRMYDIPIKVFDKSAMRYFCEGNHGLILGMGEKNIEEVLEKIEGIEQCVYIEETSYEKSSIN